MNRGDEALNVSSLQFLRSIKRFIGSLVQFLLSVERFIAVTLSKIIVKRFIAVNFLKRFIT